MLELLRMNKKDLEDLDMSNLKIRIRFKRLWKMMALNWMEEKLELLLCKRKKEPQDNVMITKIMNDKH